MLMVIFGAGASYDSSPDFPPPRPQGGSTNQSFSPRLDPPHPREAWRPPLTNQLFLDETRHFGDIVQDYPKLQGILPFLRRPQNRRTVEQQLELYLAEASTDEERKCQLLSVRYYLNDLFRRVSDEWLKHTNGVSNYATLIDQIRHRNPPRELVCLVSFNYDLLLDHALFPSGNPQAPDHHFEAHPIFKLFKPHGSVDWGRVVASPRGLTAGQVPENIIQRAPDLTLSDQYVRVDAKTPFQSLLAPIVPAIAIPVQTKTDDFFEWPKGHRALFEQVLSQVTKILIIGWRAQETHFMNLLRERLPSGGVTQITHLQVVGRDSTEVENICKQFLADIDRKLWKSPALHAQGFSDFVREEQVGFFFND